MPKPTRNRASKYDVIYGLQIGQYFDVPDAGHSGPLTNKSGDYATDYRARAEQINSIVPTTISNLTSVLHRHTLQTGHKYKIDQMRAETPVRDPNTGTTIIKIRDVLRVTRMPDSWTPVRKKIPNNPATARQRAYRASKDLILRTAWDVIEGANLPAKRAILRDKNHPDYEATAAWLAEFKQAYGPEAELVRVAHNIARMVIADACETLLAERSKTYNAKHEVTLAHENVRRIHPDRDKAKAILQQKLDADYKDKGISILERAKNVAGQNWTVLVAVDMQAMDTEAMRAQQALEKQQRDLARVLSNGPPANRMCRDVPYNYLWREDFVQVRPEIHPIQPGEQALVCFTRVDIQASTTEPRIEDVRNQIARANQRWQQFVDENPDCGIEAPQYGIVGRYMHGGETIFVLERLSRDSESGAYSDSVVRWDLSRPESLPVRPGTYRSLACGRPTAQGWEPARSSAEVHDAVMTLRHRYNIFCSFTPQAMHGAGVYMIGRIAAKDGNEVDLSEASQASQDNNPSHGSLSDIMGE